MFSIFILTTSIGIGSSRGPSSEQEDAYKALAKATYIQTGADKRLKYLEKALIPDPIRKHGGTIASAAKIVIERRISFEWTF